MFTNRIALLAYGCVLFFFNTGAVHANTVTIQPAASEVTAGEELSLTTLMGFEEATVGGGMTLSLALRRSSLKQRSRNLDRYRWHERLISRKLPGRLCDQSGACHTPTKEEEDVV